MSTYTLYSDKNGVPTRLASPDGFVVAPPADQIGWFMDLDSNTSDRDIIERLSHGNWEAEWRLKDGRLTHKGEIVK